MQSKNKTQIGVILDSIFNNYITLKNKENQIKRNEIIISSKNDDIKNILLANIKDFKGKQIEKAKLLGWKPEVLSYIEHGDRTLNTEKLSDIVKKLHPTDELYERLIRIFVAQNTEIKIHTVQQKIGSAYSFQYIQYSNFLHTALEILILLEILGDKGESLPSEVDFANVQQNLKQICSKLLDVVEGKKSA